MRTRPLDRGAHPHTELQRRLGAVTGAISDARRRRATDLTNAVAAVARSRRGLCPDWGEWAAPVDLVDPASRDTAPAMTTLWCRSLGGVFEPVAHGSVSGVIRSPGDKMGPLSSTPDRTMLLRDRGDHTWSPARVRYSPLNCRGRRLTVCRVRVSVRRPRAGAECGRQGSATDSRRSRRRCLRRVVRYGDGHGTAAPRL
jgi:hypothetical protein